ncbi:MAG TPA: cytochrome b/b6 domain-containing protein [Microbacteriaceae bacterium]|nr:cytochrome b/b6 domain-containing protein [Microbacteriaceae bacterium]
MPLSRQRRSVRIAAGVVLSVVVVVWMSWARTTSPIAQFIADYPGEAPSVLPAPVGIPAWLAWQHYLNAFFIVLIIRTGWIIRRRQRPPAFWIRHDSAVMRLTGRRQRLGIYHWFHLSLDGLWLLNGLIYVVLLFATGQWLRIVPTDWAVVPNALSALIQYLSLDWPTDSGWTNYNALQQLSYFAVVFVLSPIAVLTGLRLSPAWPLEGRLARVLPEQLTRRIHGLNLYAFVVFVVVHVVLVLGTGALRNLNVMFAGNNGESWLGAGVFTLAIATMVGAWILVTPALLKRLASLSGDVR